MEEINNIISNAAQITLPQRVALYVPGTQGPATAGLVRESVTIVFAACTADQLRDRLPDVLTLAQQIKQDMAQEAVTITIDQKMYII